MLGKTLSFNNEVYRKVFHISSIIIPLVYILLDFNYFIIFLLISTIFLISINLNYNKFINMISPKVNLDFVIRNYEKNSFWSASYMIITFLLVTCIFPKDVAVLSMIIGSVCDPLAGLCGQKYGKIILVHNKTLEGTYVFIISSFLIVSYFTGTISSFLLILCLLIALTELITPMKYDNVSIPIVSSILFSVYNLF